jgi:hypothetical protein
MARPVCISSASVPRHSGRTFAVNNIMKPLALSRTVRRLFDGFCWTRKQTFGTFAIFFTAISCLAYNPPLTNIITSLEGSNSNCRVTFSAYNSVLGTTHAGDSGVFAADTVWGPGAQEGVVLWQTVLGSNYTVYFSVYDPNVQRWQTTNSGPFAEPLLPATYGGVVTWYRKDAGGYYHFGVSAYDPLVQGWITEDSGRITCGSGSSGGCYWGIPQFQERNPTTWYERCWMFDPLRHQWRSARYGP